MNLTEKLTVNEGRPLVEEVFLRNLEVCSLLFARARHVLEEGMPQTVDIKEKRHILVLNGHLCRDQGLHEDVDELELIRLHVV